MRSVAIAGVILLTGCGLLEPGESRIIEVMEGRVPCYGAHFQECQLVRGADGSIGYMYSGIDGFEPEPGYRYRLRVRTTQVHNPPADAPAVRHELEWIESKQRSPYYELLADARARYAGWRETGPTSYEIVLERACYCAPEGLGPVAVEVERTGASAVPFERVVSARYVNGGGEVGSTYRHFFPGVEGLYAVLTVSAARDADDITVEYGQGGNVPVRILVDGREMVQDDEFEIRVLALEPLP